MKILGFEIGRQTKAVEVENVTRKINERLKVVEKVVQREYSRTTQDVSKWRQQTIVAESIHNPNRAELLNIYKDVVLDAHLSGLMKTIELKLTSGDLLLCNNDGEVDEDETQKLKEKWFFEYVKYFVESIFYGHSLVQIENVKDDKFELSLVDRKHVVPEFGIVKQDAWSYATDGTNYRERPFADWLIEIGDKKDLGLLHKATPYVLWKKGVMGAWSHYSEIFGMPLRLGKTSINNPTNKANMEGMLENMANASWAVIGQDDQVEFVETNNTDAYNIYDRLVERANSELSKLVLTQTGTTEEKAHVGSAEVHERLLDQLINSLKNDLLFNFKAQVLPKMERLGMVKKGLVAKWDNTEKLDVKERFEMVEKLLVHYKIDPEFIKSNFGIDVEEKTTFGQSKTVMNEIKNLYNLD